MTSHGPFRILTVCAAIFLSSMVYAAGTPAFPSPPSNIVSSATAVTWNYRYSHDYSAHTNGAYICGKMMTYVMASRAGNTATDYRLMRQIRANLTGDMCLVAAGGYGSQHERLFTGTCAIIKATPRLWAQLTETEKYQMDLLMKASIVASAYTTSDRGNASSQNRDLMGGTNLGRGWNPNFREGMIGAMIVGTAWMGGAEATYDFLDNYDHAAFTAELLAAGLTNTYITFNYKVDNPTSYAPSASSIENDVYNYEYYGYRLDELMEIYWSLTTFTYDRYVNTGLNGGVGISGYGRMIGGQAGLPNVGVLGMLHEFDGTDGSGFRSSAGYAYDGFRPNLVNQIVMMICGYWEPGTMADECVSRMRIGIEDLFYKLQYGYYNYSNGHTSGSTWMTDDGRDFYWMQSTWYDVIEPYHDGLLTCADAGADFVAPDNDNDGYGEAVLDGSASIAGSGTIITGWCWSMDSSVIATGETASVTLPVGTHEITLTVTDSSSATSVDTVTVSVEVPPIAANAGDDVTVYADTSGQATLTLDGSGSFSRDGVLLVIAWKDNGAALASGSLTPTVTLATGVHTITLNLVDSKSQTASDTVTVTVEPSQAVPGDANGDGHVNLDDFIILKQNYGISSGASLSQGDFNGDGAVNLDDFIILKQNYGS